MTPAYFLVIALLPAVALGWYRLLAGPTRADRVVALDLLFAIAVFLCICAALATGHTAFLDVGIGLALMGFIATLAWARLIERLAAGSEVDE